jgi:hypothetical protein
MQRRGSSGRGHLALQQGTRGRCFDTLPQPRQLVLLEANRLLEAFHRRRNRLLLLLLLVLHVVLPRCFGLSVCVGRGQECSEAARRPLVHRVPRVGRLIMRLPRSHSTRTRLGRVRPRCPAGERGESDGNGSE